MSVFLEREHVLLCRHTVPSVDVDLIHLHAKINLTLITLLTKSTQFYLPKLVGSAPVAVACLDTSPLTAIIDPPCCLLPINSFVLLLSVEASS